MKFTILAALGLIAAAGPPAAPGAEQAAWLSGAELERMLSQSSGASWSGTPLREGLQSFSRIHRLAILVDRRVDPGRPLRMALPEQPLRATCHAIAAELGLGFTLVGPVGYFGPSATTHRLRTLVAIKTAEAQQLPADLRPKLARTATLKWDALATPRELIGQLAQETGLRVVGLEQVPHDLWAEADLPPVPWVERLSLVLAQFDLTFRVDGARRTLTLELMPDEVQIERRYAIAAAGEEVVGRWRQLAPRATIELADGRITVIGRVEDHELLMPPVRPPLAPPRPGMKPVASTAQQLHSLKVSDVPLDKLLDALGQRLNLTIRLDREAAQKAGIPLQQLVSLNVQNVSTDELLDKLLAPLGLGFRRDGAAVEVFPTQ